MRLTLYSQHTKAGHPPAAGMGLKAPARGGGRGLPGGARRSPPATVLAENDQKKNCVSDGLKPESCARHELPFNWCDLSSEALSRTRTACLNQHFSWTTNYAKFANEFRSDVSHASHGLVIGVK